MVDTNKPVAEQTIWTPMVRKGSLSEIYGPVRDQFAELLKKSPSMDKFDQMLNDTQKSK